MRLRIPLLIYRWRLQQTLAEHLEYIKQLAEDTKFAERESHFHEIYGEILYFQCRSYNSSTVFLSLVAQYELGYQYFLPNGTFCTFEMSGPG